MAIPLSVPLSSTWRACGVMLPAKMMKAVLILALGLVATMAVAGSQAPLVLYRIGTVPVEMQEGDEFGAMLVNDGWEEDPSPRYILAIARTRTLVDTKDLQLFKAILAALPKGAEIVQYDSCTIPRSYGLKQKQIRAYKNAFKGAGLKVSAEERGTCYCPK